jgi:hypothetical protein
MFSMVKSSDTMFCNVFGGGFMATELVRHAFTHANAVLWDTKVTNINRVLGET